MNVFDMDLFAIPISLINLGEQSRKLNRDLVKCILQEMDQVEGEHRTGKGVWQSKLGLENHFECFKYLADTLFNIAKPKLNRAGFKGDVSEYMKCCSFWANVNQSPNAYHTPHIHGSGNTLFAGVYYPTSGLRNGIPISLNENLDDPSFPLSAPKDPPPGALVLMDPSGYTKTLVKPNRGKLNTYPYYGHEVCISPKEGICVIFPQYLPHMVVPTQEENLMRISIAFAINKK